MRGLKIAVFAVLGLIGLVVLAAVLLLVFVDPNAHKARLQQLVLEKTGRQLLLPGDLKLKVFPWIAVDVGRASLANGSGFAAEPMVEIEHARLGVALMPLLHGQLEIGAVELDSPTIRLAVDAKGHSNWADLTRSKEQEAADESKSSGVAAAAIAKLQIVNGTLQYRDAGAGTDLTLRALNLETGRLKSGEPFDLKLAFTLLQGKSLEAGVQLQGRTTLDLAANRYQLAAPQLDLQLKGAGLPAAGLPVQLRFEAIDADLDAQTLKLPGLKLQAAGAQLSGSLEGTKIIDAPHFAGPVQLAEVSTRELLHRLGIELPATRDPAMFRKLSFSGTLVASSEALMLDGLKLKFDDSTMTGRAGISNLASSSLAFDLKLDRINADRYLAPVPPKNAAAGNAAAGAAKAAPTAPIAVPVELLRSLNAHGTLNAGAAVFAGVQYSNLRIGVNAGGGKLHVFPSEAQMYGGQYHGDITVDASGRVPRLSVDEHLSGIDFAPLMSDMLETKRISGHGNAAIKATATGADSSAMLRTLNGTLEFHVDDGALEGADLWYEIRRARALLKQQAPPARTGPEHTPFTALSATGKFTNGVLSNEDLKVAMQYLQVSGRGSADLPASTLDYRLDAVVLKIPEETAADTQDIVGLKVPVLVTGSFASPKVRPDVSGLLKARVQQEIDKHKDEVKQKLQDKLQDKLKDLFKR
jgi:AsmA protein